MERYSFPPTEARTYVLPWRGLKSSGGMGGKEESDVPQINLGGSEPTAGGLGGEAGSWLIAVPAGEELSLGFDLPWHLTGGIDFTSLGFSFFSFK